jgi:hypothetical protein
MLRKVLWALEWMDVTVFVKEVAGLDASAGQLIQFLGALRITAV